VTQGQWIIIGLIAWTWAAFELALIVCPRIKAHVEATTDAVDGDDG